jgi:hypothetical protein
VLFYPVLSFTASGPCGNPRFAKKFNVWHLCC